MSANKKHERVRYITNRPSAEGLQLHIDNPPFGSVPLEITPELAAEMLKRNKGNRPLSKDLIGRYAAQMKKGQWHNTRVPLIFAIDGGLIDGQHRLSACIESAVPLNCDVIFGAGADVFAFIDIGKRRTAADIFSIHGVSNATMMASAMALIYSYDHAEMKGFSFGGIRRTSAELYEEYTQHPKLRDSAWVAGLFHVNRLASPSLMCALHYICSRKSRRDADDFFRKLGTGEGIVGKRLPVKVLLNKLILDQGQRDKMGRAQIGSITITAWNSSRDGRPMKQLKYYSDMAFPRAR